MKQCQERHALLKALQELKTVKKCLENYETLNFELEQAKEEISIELSQVKLERNASFQEIKILRKKLGMKWDEPVNSPVRTVSPKPTPAPNPAPTPRHTLVQPDTNEKIKKRDVEIELISNKHRLVF